MRVSNPLRGSSAWPLAFVLTASLSIASAQTQAPAAGEGKKAPAHPGDSAANASQPAASGPDASGGDDNAFPEAASRAAAEHAPEAAAPDQSSPQAPSAQKTPAPSSAAEQNPFPEDESRRAASSAAAPASSGVSSSSSVDPDVDREMTRDGARERLKKPSHDLTPGSLAAAGRAKDDIQVGGFYLSTGDFKGAYLRFTNAAMLDPASAEAIYGVAQAAQHLGRTQEAITNYKLYLDIAPDGKGAKTAHKALKELGETKTATAR